MYHFTYEVVTYFFGSCFRRKERGTLERGKVFLALVKLVPCLNVCESACCMRTAASRSCLAKCLGLPDHTALSSHSRHSTPSPPITMQHEPTSKTQSQSPAAAPTRQMKGAHFASGCAGQCLPAQGSPAQRTPGFPSAHGSPLFTGTHKTPTSRPSRDILKGASMEQRVAGCGLWLQLQVVRNCLVSMFHTQAAASCNDGFREQAGLDLCAKRSALAVYHSAFSDHPGMRMSDADGLRQPACTNLLRSSVWGSGLPHRLPLAGPDGYSSTLAAQRQLLVGLVCPHMTFHLARPTHKPPLLKARVPNLTVAGLCGKGVRLRASAAARGRLVVGAVEGERSGDAQQHRHERDAPHAVLGAAGEHLVDDPEREKPCQVVRVNLPGSVPLWQKVWGAVIPLLQASGVLGAWHVHLRTWQLMPPCKLKSFYQTRQSKVSRMRKLLWCKDAAAQAGLGRNKLGRSVIVSKVSGS